MSLWGDLLRRKQLGPKNYPWEHLLPTLGRTEEKFEKMCEVRSADLRKAVEALERFTSLLIEDWGRILIV